MFVVLRKEICGQNFQYKPGSVFQQSKIVKRQDFNNTILTWHRFSNRECNNNDGECWGDDLCDLCSAQDPPRRRKRRHSGQTRSRKWSISPTTRLTTTSHPTPPSSSCSMHPVSQTNTCMENIVPDSDMDSACFGAF